VAARAAFDTQDYAFFPSRGFKANIEYFDALRTTAGQPEYAYAEGRLSGAWSYRDVVLLGGIAGGTATKGTLPFGEAFYLGGIGRLAAYAPAQIIGREAYGLGSIQAQYQLNKATPFLGFAVRVGAIYEAGYMKNPITEPKLTGRIESYGLYLATNTIFGPIYLGYARARGDDSGRFYLFVGTP
jgi:outer membrane protein assembly factor BamA